jgi:hypothetical protein
MPTLERVANKFRALKISFDQLDAFSSTGITGRYCICHRYPRRSSWSSTGPLSLEESPPRSRRFQKTVEIHRSPFAPFPIRTHPSPESLFEMMSYCICRGICRHNRVHHVYGCIVHSRRQLSRSNIQASPAHLIRHLTIHTGGDAEVYRSTSGSSSCTYAIKLSDNSTRTPPARRTVSATR